MSKKVYVLMVCDDCVYQDMIVGIFDTKDGAEQIIAQIESNEYSDIGHAILSIHEHEINNINEELLNYNSLFL